MIIKEFYKIREDGLSLYKTYSNESYYIEQVETGNIYEEAIDIESNNFTYKETNKKIPIFDESEEITDEYNIKLNLS